MIQNTPKHHIAHFFLTDITTVWHDSCFRAVLHKKWCGCSSGCRAGWCFPNSSFTYVEVWSKTLKPKLLLMCVYLKNTLSCFGQMLKAWSHTTVYNMYCSIMKTENLTQFILLIFNIGPQMNQTARVKQLKLRNTHTGVWLIRPNPSTERACVVQFD